MLPLEIEREILRMRQEMLLSSLVDEEKSRINNVAYDFYVDDEGDYILELYIYSYNQVPPDMFEQYTQIEDDTFLRVIEHPSQGIYFYIIHVVPDAFVLELFNELDQLLVNNLQTMRISFQRANDDDGIVVNILATLEVADRDQARAILEQGGWGPELERLFDQVRVILILA